MLRRTGNCHGLAAQMWPDLRIARGACCCPPQVLGGDEVPEEEARHMCREIVGVVKRLKVCMGLNLRLCAVLG